MILIFVSLFQIHNSFKLELYGGSGGDENLATLELTGILSWQAKSARLQLW